MALNKILLFSFFFFFLSSSLVLTEAQTQKEKKSEKTEETKTKKEKEESVHLKIFKMQREDRKREREEKKKEIEERKQKLEEDKKKTEAMKAERKKKEAVQNKKVEARTQYCMKRTYLLPDNEKKYKIKEGTFVEVKDGKTAPPDATSNYFLYEKIKFCIYCADGNQPGLDPKKCQAAVQSQVEINKLKDEQEKKEFEEKLKIAFDTAPKTFAALFKLGTQIYKTIKAMREKKKKREFPKGEEAFGVPQQPQRPGDSFIPPPAIPEQSFTLPTAESPRNFDKNGSGKSNSFLGFGKDKDKKGKSQPGDPFRSSPVASGQGAGGAGVTGGTSPPIVTDGGDHDHTQPFLPSQDIPIAFSGGNGGDSVPVDDSALLNLLADDEKEAFSRLKDLEAQKEDESQQRGIANTSVGGLEILMSNVGDTSREVIFKEYE